MNREQELKQRLDNVMATIQNLMFVYRDLAAEYDAISELKKIPAKFCNFRRNLL